MKERYPEINQPNGKEVLPGDELTSQIIYACVIYVSPIGEKATDLTREDRWKEVPRKIETRLKLFKYGLNTLPTAIIHPDAAQSLEGAPLLKVFESLNTMNSGLCLPKTKDLIIRSARTAVSSGKETSPAFSEPALLIKNLGEEEQEYTLLSHDNIPHSSLSEFTKSLGLGTWLMIHLDDYLLQTRAIHGRLVENDDYSWHNLATLNLATGVLHARNVESIKDNVPFIEYETPFLEDFFDSNPDILVLRLKKTAQNEHKPRESMSLLEKIRPLALTILTGHKIVENTFGQGYVVEFRIYPTLPEGVGSNFQVLDVNKNF